MRCNINKSCLTFSAAAAAVPIAASKSTRTPRPFAHTMPRRRRPSFDNNATVENVLLYYRRRRRCACVGVNRSRGQSRAPEGSVSSPRCFPPPFGPLHYRRTNKSSHFQYSVVCCRGTGKRLYTTVTQLHLCCTYI